MKNHHRVRNFSASWLAVWLALAVVISAAQSATAFQYPGAPGQEPGLSIGGNQPLLGEGDRVPKLEAGFTKLGADRTAQLFIVATMPEGAHTYSITQPAGGPIRTKIKVDTTADVPVIGKFRAAGKPEVKHDEDAFPGIPLEEQAGKVKWFAPIQVSGGAKPEAVKIEGKVTMQLCDAMGCVMPKDYAFTATYRPDVAAATEPAEAPAAKPQEKPAAPPSPAPQAPASSGSSPASPPAAGNAKSAVTQAETAPPARPAKKQLAWRQFTTIGDLREVVGGNFNVEAIHANVQHAESQMSVTNAILFGFLGGLILNIMPCVLPVIGLKILSFVQQSGHHRGRALALNVWYSAGLLAVFLILASLAVGPQKLGWGQLFGETWFTITLTAVVFVMGLSFMGLWEVPLPAFLGSGKAGELASQEGAVGAFFKGALTTLLATPCSAPFLAPALVWATSQPPWLTYVVFTSVGLGMASPYLLVGAFPELLKFLPKPGAWMETFKQGMGFVLMGTVVYLLTIIEPYNVIPTIGLLFALWLGCWWIGRIDPVADISQKLRAWAFATAFCGIVWIAMFPGFNHKSLPDVSFSGLAAIMQQRLGLEGEEEAVDDAPQVVGPKIVLIDFTADWCLTCKQNEAKVMHTAAVVDEIKKLDVLTLKADWTHKAKAYEVTRMLDILGGRQVPVIAVFSPADPNHPSVFRGSYTQQDILDALKKAAEPPQPEVASS